MARDPEFTVVQTVRLSKKMKDELRKIAEHADRDEAWIIRKAIDEYIDKYIGKAIIDKGEGT